MSDEKLDDIKNLLEDLKSIMMLTNQEKIEDAKKKLLKSDSIEETVYKLCDGVNTTVEISTAIQKDSKYTLTVLGKLRQKGLIKTIEKNGKKIHEQRF
jgi:hypothetical protein